jgi:hypothetical protein
MIDSIHKKFDAFRWACLGVILIVGVVTPSIVILLLEITVGDIAPSISMKDIAQRQFAEGHNLFSLAMFGLIPFVALSILLFDLSRKLTTPRFCFFAACGLIGILSLMIPAHASVWRPLYTDEHASSTAVIAFIFIPFYCLATMGIGISVASLSLMPAWIRKLKMEHGESFTRWWS